MGGDWVWQGGHWGRDAIKAGNRDGWDGMWCLVIADEELISASELGHDWRLGAAQEAVQIGRCLALIAIGGRRDRGASTSAFWDGVAQFKSCRWSRPIKVVPHP